MSGPKVGCGYPGCTAEIVHRPYARKRDGVPSSSAIAELLDDGKSSSFAWSASLIAATTAVHRAHDWNGLVGVQSDRAVQHGHTKECTHEKDGLCKACTFLRSEHDRQWKAKATLGTHVHHCVDQMIHGVDVDQDEVTAPFFDAFSRFVTECSPQWVLTESTILYDRDRSHMYRGQIDGICDLINPDTFQLERWLVDWKTGGYYPVSQTLQMAGYRFADHLTDWSSGDEVVIGKVPTVHKAGVVLLSPEGTYRLVELPANGDAHGTFLRLVDAWRWNRQMKKWADEHPYAVNEVLEGAGV